MIQTLPADTISAPVSGAGGRADGGMGHLSDPSPLRSPSPPSPLDTLPPCLARTSVAAPDPPGFQGGRISSLRWTVMVVRLAPSRPILRRPASAMGMGVRKRRKGAWASSARGELGGREEVRKAGIETWKYRPMATATSSYAYRGIEPKKERDNPLPFNATAARRQR